LLLWLYCCLMAYFTAVNFDPADFIAVQQVVDAYLQQFMADFFGERQPISASDRKNALLNALDFVPDAEQLELVDALVHYLDEGVAGSAFLLTGSAGTGKTSLLKGLVSQLKKEGTQVYLLAPTGRAAKVLGSKTGVAASTIHKQIYLLEERFDAKGAIHGFSFMLREFETEEPAVFIVDEASMIASLPSREGLLRTNGLLQDLLHYVFDNSGWNRLIFVGDPYQLPPVHELESAALSPATLEQLGLAVDGYQLEVVKRQQSNSGILELATSLRDRLVQRKGFDATDMELPDDIVQINSVDAALEHYLELYRHNPEQATFVTYSNFWAHRINTKFRRLLYNERDALPKAGEQLLVIRNHYLNKTDFIANGEQVELIAHEEELEDYAGLRWLKAEYGYSDIDGRYHQKRGRLVYDSLVSKEAGLSQAQHQLLLIARKNAESYGPFDPYLNALQVKYPYAITTHKAQGGEWPIVFVLMERPYGGETAYMRWLYTAITRAGKQLCLVAPN
jgi:hypothetical protein